MRLILILLISFLPAIIFTLVVIWALGHFGYAPLEPLSNSIGNLAQPYMQPLLDAIKGLLSRLPGGGAQSNPVY